MPIQGRAYFLAAFAFVNLVALAATRKRFDVSG